MTSAYAFEGVEPGVDAANKKMEAEMQSTLQGEGANIMEYVKADKDLATGANLYVNTTESSMAYRGKLVKDGEGVAYVTDRGALKSIGPASGPVYKSVVGQRGCPRRVEKTTVSSQDNNNGTVGNDPYFFKGTPMGLNEPCGTAGINNQVMGASIPASNERTWEGKCLLGIHDRFSAQDDIVGKTAKNTLDSCHARAADIGASSFYVRRENQRKFACFVSPPSKTFDDMIDGGTDATVEVRSSRWIAEKPLPPYDGREEAAGILNDGTIVIGAMPDSNDDDFASAVDMVTTSGTALTNEALGVKAEGCDPVGGASIKVHSATFGNNCGGMPLTEATETFSEEPTQVLPPTPPPSPTPEPPAAGPEQAPMEYWQHDGGPCGAQHAITSAAECKAAAEAQGLTYAGEAAEAASHIDCFRLGHKAGAAGAVAWARTAPAHRATPHAAFGMAYSAICQKPAEGTPAPEPEPEPAPMEYWQVPKGGGACPAANAITSAAECSAAAEAKGLVFDGEAGANPDHVDCFQALDGREVKSVTWAKTSATDRAAPGGYFKAHYSALCQKPAGGGGKTVRAGPGSFGRVFQYGQRPIIRGVLSTVCGRI